ncbi:MAG: CDP-alcohol phosphatidyltransferase family protein [Patescibacteria group bacterium]
MLISGFIDTLIYLFFYYAVRNARLKVFFLKHKLFFYPNNICYWRTLLGWIGVACYFLFEWHSLGIFLLTTSATLDGVDGEFARNFREYGWETELGKELDPLCDKLTYIPSMFGFALQGSLPIKIVRLFSVIEAIGQFGVRWLVKYFKAISFLNHPDWSVAANNIGKIKAVLCFGLLIYLGILDDGIVIPNFSVQALYLCIILGVGSAFFKIVPNWLYANILSCLNLICGLTGIIFAFNRHFVLATLAVIAGQVFDLFDGRMAEKHGSTEFGKYFDDGADFVSFGICPAIIIFVHGNWQIWPIFFGAIYIAAVGYRLYRFAKKDKLDPSIPIGIFNGLPCPAGAMVILGTCLFWQYSTTSQIIVFLTSYLLVTSRIRFVHLRKYILPRLHRVSIIILGFIMMVIISYLVMVKDSEKLGFVLLIISGLYVFIFNSFNRIIKTTHQ